jgi:hypothetical protein
LPASKEGFGGVVLECTPELLVSYIYFLSSGAGLSILTWARIVLFNSKTIEPFPRVYNPCL